MANAKETGNEKDYFATNHCATRVSQLPAPTNTNSRANICAADNTCVNVNTDTLYICPTTPAD
jgi:hypothetical protein